MVEEVSGGRFAMKVLVVGSGAIGSVIGRILQSRPEFEEIILADLKQETAQLVAANAVWPLQNDPNRHERQQHCRYEESNEGR